MQKKIIPLITLSILIFISNNVLSQNLVSKLIEKKTVIPKTTIERIVTKKIREQQFTNDTREDLELFAAVNPTDKNNIIASWMSINASATATYPLLFKMKYTTNGGDTWQESDIDFMPHNISQQNRAIGGGGDPVIAFDKNGRAHFSWLYLVANVVSMEEIYMDLVLHYAYSDDKGATWTRPENDTIAWGVFDYELNVGITAVDSGYPPDKQWMAVNPTNNDLFISTTEFYHADSITDIWGIRRKPADSLFYVSEQKLIPPSDLFATTQGAICFDDNGVLHAVYPAYRDTSKILANEDEIATEFLYYQNSFDNGKNWSDTVAISNVFVNNMSAALQENNTNTKAYNRLYASPYITVDTSGGEFDGRIYVIWNSNDTNYFSNVNVHLSYSDDNGQTWAEPIMVNSDLPDDYKFHHRPSINVTPNGKVIANWYDTRNAEIPNVYDTDFFVGISFDGGNSFIQKNINDTLFNFNEINSDFYVGEYSEIAVTNSFIYVFWSHLTDQDQDLEIYYAKVSADSSLTGIEEYGPLTANMSVNLFPNPVKNLLKVDIKTQNQQIIDFKIYSVNGKLLKNLSENCTKGQNKIAIDVSDLKSSTYILILKTENGTFYRKFLKQ